MTRDEMIFLRDNLSRMIMGNQPMIAMGEYDKAVMRDRYGSNAIVIGEWVIHPLNIHCHRTVTVDFIREIQHVINCHSKENGSDTPDFILAEYLNGCLETFNKTVQAREKWYGRKPGLLFPSVPKPQCTMEEP